MTEMVGDMLKTLITVFSHLNWNQSKRTIQSNTILGELRGIHSFSLKLKNEISFLFSEIVSNVNISLLAVHILLRPRRSRLAFRQTP